MASIIPSWLACGGDAVASAEANGALAGSTGARGCSRLTGWTAHTAEGNAHAQQGGEGMPGLA
jgi:hypothetical protein